jgi:hypothetical protein
MSQKFIPFLSHKSRVLTGLMHNRVIGDRAKAREMLQPVAESTIAIDDRVKRSVVIGPSETSDVIVKD